MVLNSDTNKPFQGICWPGLSSWADFYNPNIKQIWEQLFKNENYFMNHEIHTWIDMNEPSVFEEKDTTIPPEKL